VVLFDRQTGRELTVTAIRIRTRPDDPFKPHVNRNVPARGFFLSEIMNTLPLRNEGRRN
jgi:hypothetical protein